MALGAGACVTPAEARTEALPELTRTAAEDWINSKPLKVADFRGSAALVHVWTFACWNCYRSFPWLTAMEKRLGARVKVVGIHTPELEHERDKKALRAKVSEYGLPHAVMIDDDHAYWRALGTRYWPSWYLVDKRGRVRALFTGETHENDEQAVRIERDLGSLAAE